jgi:hypothetical protein
MCGTEGSKGLRTSCRKNLTLSLVFPDLHSGHHTRRATFGPTVAAKGSPRTMRQPRDVGRNYS